MKDGVIGARKGSAFQSLEWDWGESGIKKLCKFYYWEKNGHLRNFEHWYAQLKSLNYVDISNYLNKVLYVFSYKNNKVAAFIATVDNIEKRDRRFWFKFTPVKFVLLPSEFMKDYRKEFFSGGREDPDKWRQYWKSLDIERKSVRDEFDNIFGSASCQDQYHLFAVASLPAGVFNPYSGVKTSILFMDRQLAKKCDSILFLKIENDGFGLGAQRREQIGSDLPDAVNVISDYMKAARSGALNFFKTEEKPCGALLVKKEKLAENEEYNLSGDRYRTIEKRVNQKWPMVSLGEVSQVIAGQSPEGEYYNDRGEGTPFYQGKTEFADKYIGSPVKWTTQETRIAEKDDILISVRAPVGPVNISTQRICIGRGLAAIRVSEKILMPYLFTLLKINEKNIKGNGGAVFDSINRKDIEAIPVPLPPLEVQREIVAEIENYQKLIDGARQVVESWKPQIEIDSNWPINILKELADIKTGKIDVNKAEENGIYPFFTCAKEPYRINEFAFDCEALLLAGNNATADYDVKYYKGKFNTYQRTYIITIPNDLILYPYLKIIMESNLGHLKRNSIGSQTKYLTLGVIQGIQIPLPPIEIQHEIVAKIEAERNVVDGCKDLIALYETKIKKVIDKVWEE
jgi:restriction endonuclease S subunit